jgi:hypothetical protein
MDPGQWFCPHGYLFFDCVCLSKTCVSRLYEVLDSAKTGLYKLVRGRRPRLERHVGIAWLCRYAAYSPSRAQLIPKTTTRTLLLYRILLTREKQ